jgi:hypothetical protein
VRQKHWSSCISWGQEKRDFSVHNKKQTFQSSKKNTFSSQNATFQPRTRSLPPAPKLSSQCCFAILWTSRACCRKEESRTLLLKTSNNTHTHTHLANKGLIDNYAAKPTIVANKTFGSANWPHTLKRCKRIDVATCVWRIPMAKVLCNRTPHYKGLQKKQPRPKSKSHTNQSQTIVVVAKIYNLAASRVSKSAKTLAMDCKVLYVWVVVSTCVWHSCCNNVFDI